MNSAEALSHMIPPGQPRPGKPKRGVIQIWVTRACDKACYNCTQGANLKRSPGVGHFISLKHFEQACESLVDYFGTVGVFGGNPAMHPQFDTLCEILRKYIPFERRGLWCNRLMGKGAAARATFNPVVSNLNVHLDSEAYAEFRRDWPECRPFGLNQDSRHSPVYVALQDMVRDESERWDLISKCDINQHWSAMICVVRDQLRGYFCEIAGAQAMLHQNEEDWVDVGVPIDAKWWRRPMEDFQEQMETHCPACGVPLRGRGELAQAVCGVEQVTATHANIYQPKDSERRVDVITHRDQLNGQTAGRMTDYLGNAGKP